jgi:hypothetical protein
LCLHNNNNNDGNHATGADADFFLHAQNNLQKFSLEASVLEKFIRSASANISRPSSGFSKLLRHCSLPPTTTTTSATSTTTGTTTKQHV